MTTLLEWLKSLDSNQLRLYTDDKAITETEALNFVSQVSRYGLIAFEKLPATDQNNLMKSFISIID